LSSSSRIRPLKASQLPFCIGLPGAIWCHLTCIFSAHSKIAFEVNSVPLSGTITPGFSRRSISAYNFGRRLKTLKGLTPYEFICKCWASEPERFTINPAHHMPGLNILCVSALL